MQPFEQLEHEFGMFCGIEDTVCCSSGTSALHLAFEALRLPRYSRVLCPDFTMVACARAIVMADLVPVFIDCREDDLNIDVELVARAIEEIEEVKAILAVHTYGRQCNMDGIHELSGKYDLRVVEDLAEAHGLYPHWNTDVSCYSFYKNKVVAGEEGGMCAFKYQENAEYAKSLRCLGFTKEHDYTHIPRGHNYRLANLLATPILDSLRKYEENRYKREVIADLYDSVCPSQWRMPKCDANWVYDIRIKGMSSVKQTEVVKTLRSEGIEARHAFKPMHTLTEFSGRFGNEDDEVLVYGQESVANIVSREVIYLPCDPNIVTKEYVTKAFSIICRVL